MFAGDVLVESQPRKERRVAVDARFDVVLRLDVTFRLGVDVDSVDAVFDRMKIRCRPKIDLTPAANQIYL